MEREGGRGRLKDEGDEGKGRLEGEGKWSGREGCKAKETEDERTEGGRGRGKAEVRKSFLFATGPLAINMKLPFARPKPRTEHWT